MSGSLMSPFQPTVVRGFCDPELYFVRKEKGKVNYLAEIGVSIDRMIKVIGCLQVSPHDDKKVWQLGHFCFQEVGVLHRLFW